MFSKFDSNRAAVSQILKFGGAKPNLGRTSRTLGGKGKRLLTMYHT